MEGVERNWGIMNLALYQTDKKYLGKNFFWDYMLRGVLTAMVSNNQPVVIDFAKQQCKCAN
jgi:hypothetical protein